MMHPWGCRVRHDLVTEQQPTLNIMPCDYFFPLMAGYVCVCVCVYVCVCVCAKLL